MFSKQFELLKNAWASAAGLIGLPLSGLSLFTVFHKFINMQPSSMIQLVVEAYHQVVTQPIVLVLSTVGISISTYVASLISLYVIFGATTVLTLYNVYDPMDGVRVVKGVWGRISGFFWPKGDPRKWWVRLPHTFAATISWPLIVLEYSIFYRNIWHRYMDDGGRPGPQIGTGTSNAKTVSALRPSAEWCKYNPRFDYDRKSDTWFALKGNVVTLFLFNFLLSMVFFAVMVGISYLG